MWFQINEFFFGMIEAIGLVIYTIYEYSIFLILIILLLIIIAMIISKIKEKIKSKN